MHASRLDWLAGALCAAATLLASCSGGNEISPADMPAFEVSLATFPDSMALSWHGGRLAHSALYLQFVDAKGRPSGEPQQLTDGLREAYEPDLIPFDRQMLLAWYEKNATSGESTALLARIDATGRVLWRRELSGAHRNGRNAVVRIAGQQILTAWIETGPGESPAVWFTRLNAAGESLEPAQLVGPASKETWNLNAAVDGTGEFYVVYDANLGQRASELQLLRIRPDGTMRSVLSTDDGFASLYPDLAIDGKHVAVTWFDARDGNQEVYLFTGSLATLNAPIDARAARITHTEGASIGAYLAWNGNHLGLAWCDEVGLSMGVYAEIFDPTGRPLEAARRLSVSNSQARSMIPSIRPWRDGFVVAWNAYTADNDGSLHGKARSSVAELAFFP